MAPKTGKPPAQPSTAATTRPCPGCGRPAPVEAKICTHCGQQLRAGGEQLETTIGKPEHSGLPPIPAIAPGPSRFRPAPIDYEGRWRMFRSVVTIIACLGITCLWKWADSAPEETVIPYLIRYSIAVAGAWVICAMGAMMFIEVGASFLGAALGVAAAIAAGDLAQHAIHYTLVPTLAWVAACTVCIFVLADVLDIELPESAFLSLLIYLMKWILSITFFASMFAVAAPTPEG